MSKTESREFWVSKDMMRDLQDDSLINITKCMFTGKNIHLPPCKITITWNKSDKVVTISESEFDKACSYLFQFGQVASELHQLREKLFKDKV